MKLKRLFSVASCLLLIVSTNGCSKNNDTPSPVVDPDNEVPFKGTAGEILPPWTPGTLDIHSISTGRGESYFYIFPDGTSMLIDAAGSLVTDAVVEKDPEQNVAPLIARPSINISSGNVIADYVMHFNPYGNAVDYWLNSHFDTDHMGNFPETYSGICEISRAIKKHPEGGFYLNGINEVGTLLDFDKIIDRDYTSPVDRSGEKRFKDYIRFLNWTRSVKGTVYEAAKVGHADQIVMNHSASDYPDFKIRVLCGGGYYWTGKGVDKETYLPLDDKGKPDSEAIRMMSPKENIYSIAIMLDWGKFNLFSGGDLQYNNRSICSWLDAEAPLCDIVHEVEVMKANHHGINNANSFELLDRLRPQTLLLSPWRAGQPKPGALKDIVKASPYVNIFSTGVAMEQRQNISEYANRFKSWEGHVVVRVSANGDYMVFVLDDSNQSYKIKSVYGVYRSK